MKIIIYFLLLILPCLFLNRCVSLKLEPLKVKFDSIPKNYPKRFIDTNSINTTNKNIFFKDTCLIELIKIGLEKNIDLMTTFQNIKIAEAKLNISNSKRYPTISTEINAGVKKYGLYTFDGAGILNTHITDNKLLPNTLPDFLIGFSSSWEIDFLGKLKNFKDASLNRYLSTFQGFKWIKTNLIVEIAKNYFNLIALDNELVILDSTLEIQNKVLEIIKIQKQAGRVTELAVLKYKTQYLNSLALKKKVEQNIVEVESNLNFILGRYNNTINRNKLQYNIKNISQLKQGLPSDLLINRTDIIEAELNLEASKLDVKATKKMFYPSININANLGMQAFDLGLLTSPKSFAYNLLGGLVAPLFNKKAIEGQYLISDANQKQALFDYQKKILNAFFEVYINFKKLDNIEVILKLKEEEVANLKLASEVANYLFQANKISYLEMLIIQQNLLEAEISLNNILKEKLIFSTNLYKVLGGD